MRSYTQSHECQVAIKEAEHTTLLCSRLYRTGAVTGTVLVSYFTTSPCQITAPKRPSGQPGWPISAMVPSPP
jgi:hypothetical protein